MVLIVSQKADLSTCEVMDWVRYFNHECVRINVDEDLLKSLHFDIHDLENLALYFEDEIIKLEDIKGYWYRRGGIPKYYQKKDTLPEFFNTSQIKSKVYQHLKSEDHSLNVFLHYVFENGENKVLGNKKTADICKLVQLDKATRVGFKVPKSIVTSEKRYLKKFKETHGEIITKGVQEVILTQDDDNRYFGYTEGVSDEVIDSLPDHFFPSFFQEKIEKQYELRVFYLNGVCYSMAIFSQNDQQTETDFRKYNRDKENRRIPYQLPNDIAEKVHALMQSLKLHTGSLDLIYSVDNEYVYLEVNPVGQFGMVSDPCNYQLEKKIAQYLIS